MLRRPIKALNHREGEKNRSVSIVTVQWRLQPLLQMIPHVLLASTWLNKLWGKTRTLSSYSTSRVQVFFILEERAIFFNPLVGENWFFVLASFPSLTAGSLDSYTIVLLGYLILALLVEKLLLPLKYTVRTLSRLFYERSQFPPPDESTYLKKKRTPARLHFHTY